VAGKLLASIGHSITDILDIAAGLGYSSDQIEVVHFYPFRAGRSRAGHRLTNRGSSHKILFRITDHASSSAPDLRLEAAIKRVRRSHATFLFGWIHPNGLNDEDGLTFLDVDGNYLLDVPVTGPFFDLPWHTLIVPSAGVTLVSGAVSQINDLSGNGRHFTQGTAANRPTIVNGPHGKPEIVFDGVNDHLATASQTLPTNYVVWCVARVLTLPSALAHHGHLWVQVDNSPVGWSDRLGFGVGNDVVLATGDVSVGGIVIPIQTTTAYALVASSYPTGRLRVNNVVTGSAAVGANGAPVTGTMNLGNQPGGGTTATVHAAIAAFGVIDTDELDDLEAALATIHSYAVAQWGVAP
jgi:hypothetical protein